jgi:hypothetical protein
MYHEGNLEAGAAGFGTTSGASAHRCTVARAHSLHWKTDTPDPCSRNVSLRDAQWGQMGRIRRDMQTDIALAMPPFPAFLLVFPASYTSRGM